MLARVALKSAAQRCTRMSVPAVQTVRKSTLSGEEYLARSKEPYTVRQEAKGRFVSPHTDIYAFPVAAISSVTTRFTGVGLTVGFYGASVYALLGGDVPALLDSFKVAAPAVVLAGSKFVVGFPLVYHWLGGLRHMYIDRNPGMLNNDSIEMSSKVGLCVMPSRLFVVSS